MAASLERIAVEIRNLQRTDIREVEEPFRKGQKGSSAMPHKRNPIGCENVSGLARVVRGTLVPALENVALPMLYDRSGRTRDPNEMARRALERVGLGNRLDHEPNQMSGGQQQRVAIARALVNDPSLVLADEPTGNLDSRTSEEVISLFQELNREGITVVLVTHEPEIAACTRRVVTMRDGRIVEDEPVSQQRVAASETELAISA